MVRTNSASYRKDLILSFDASVNRRRDETLTRVSRTAGFQTDLLLLLPVRERQKRLLMIKQKLGLQNGSAIGNCWGFEVHKRFKGCAIDSGCLPGLGDCRARSVGVGGC